MQAVDSLVDLVGDTPLVRMHRFSAGVAPTLGFSQIADAAQGVAVGVASSMSVRESESLVRSLIDLCERTRPAQAA